MPRPATQIPSKLQRSDFRWSALGLLTDVFLIEIHTANIVKIGGLEFSSVKSCASAKARSMGDFDPSQKRIVGIWCKRSPCRTQEPSTRNGRRPSSTGTISTRGTCRTMITDRSGMRPSCTQVLEVPEEEKTRFHSALPGCLSERGICSRFGFVILTFYRLSQGW